MTYIPMSVGVYTVVLVLVTDPVPIEKYYCCWMFINTTASLYYRAQLFVCYTRRGMNLLATRYMKVFTN